jgi:hypothetical protein
MANVKWVHCHHGMERPRVSDRGDGLQIWRVAANMLNKQSQTADGGGSSSLGLGGALTTLPRKTQYLLRITTHSLRTRHYLAQPKHWKMNRRFGTWNVRSLYRSGSLKMVARELGKYKLIHSGCRGGQMGQGRH